MEYTFGGKYKLEHEIGLGGCGTFFSFFSLFGSCFLFLLCLFFFVFILVSTGLGSFGGRVVRGMKSIKLVGQSNPVQSVNQSVQSISRAFSQLVKFVSCGKVIEDWKGWLLLLGNQNPRR